MDGLWVSLCVWGYMWLWDLLFGFIVAQGDAAFLHYRQIETWSHKSSGSTCYPSYLLGLKREDEGAQRRKSRNEGELRVAESLSCEKMERVRKWRGNCKELGHTCSGFKETGRDVGISVTPIGERVDRRGEGSLFSESSRLKEVWKSQSRLSGAPLWIENKEKSVRKQRE